MLANAAGDDAPVVGEVGGDVQRDAVEGDPAANPHPDRRDLGLAAAVGRHPDADAAVAAQARDPEFGEGADQPLLEIADEAAQVHAFARRQVEHDIGHPLAGP